MAKTHLNLRKRNPISYFEPDEPNFDEYLYCEDCSDYVYEYCAIHGHLLVIPDDKVPIRTKFPSYVPRAALTIPHVFLHLAPSIIPGAGLGVFSTLTLPRGVRFGPYCGQRTQEIDSMYCWQIFSTKNKPSHVIDAADGNSSNWMRYVNCARHWREQNLLAYQYQGQLYYRTIKIIPRFTELMVFYGSEFANVLHINISKYNCDKYYRDLQLSSTPFAVQQLKNYTSNLPKAINDPEKVEPIFKSIDNFDDKENETLKQTEPTTLNNENTDFHPYKVHFDGDTIKIEFQLTQDSELTCEICLKSFTKKKYLNRHIKLHNRNLNENSNINESVQYTCEKCPYTTNINHFFRKHCHSHEIRATKSKSYYAKPKKCDICDFVTSSKKVFATHWSKHKGSVYKCDHCDYCNFLKYNLARHIFKKHKELFNFNNK